jgi:hypothetical protein
MTDRDPMGPERLAELVDGAAPHGEEERALVDLLTETRALEPAAPDALRERVRAQVARDPARERRSPFAWWGSADARRRLLIAGPVAAGIAAVAIALPLVTGGDPGSPVGRKSAAGDAATALRESAPQSSAAPARAPAPPAAAGGLPAGDAQALGADPRRAQKVTASTRVKVASVTALSKASDRAMAAVRSLGGYTASSNYSVPNGSTGTNVLVFRVPVARAERAIAAFGRLGTVIGQSADIVDVTARLGAQGRAVERLTQRVDRLRADLAAQPGNAALAAQLEAAQASLRAAEARQGATRARADLARLNLTLTTEGPPAAPVKKGRFLGPLSDAGSRLAGATAWLLGALVLIGPFAAVALLAAWGAARLRRRTSRRLMGSA